MVATTIVSVSPDMPGNSRCNRSTAAWLSVPGRAKLLRKSEPTPNAPACAPTIISSHTTVTTTG